MLIHYRFGDLSRWLVAWYLDHPGSPLHAIDWLKAGRIVVSTLAAGGVLSLSQVGIILTHSARDPERVAGWVGALTLLYGAVDMAWRFTRGTPADPPEPDDVQQVP